MGQSANLSVLMAIVKPIENVKLIEKVSDDA